jgi:peptidoglycan/LPS O-acetylase OafA/YrhL
MGLFRFILASTIVIHHTHPLFGFIFLGRDAALRSFYIVSGFYMSLILNEKYLKKKNSYFLFISNRFLRLFPLYWISLILTLLYLLIFVHFRFDTHVDPHQYILRTNTNIPFWSFSPMNIIRNVTLLIRTDYLTTNPNLRDMMFSPVVYTLVFEWLFYFIAPFVVRRSTIFLLTLICISCFIRIFTFAILRINGNPIGDWFFPGMMFYFLFGVLSYKIYKHICNEKFRQSHLVFVFIIFILITLLYSNINFFPDKILIWSPVKEWLYLLLLILVLPFMFILSKRIKFDRKFGDLSYPIYLTHPIMILLLSNIALINTQSNAFTLMILATTVIFSMLLNILVENPINSFRQWRVSHSTTAHIKPSLISKSALALQRVVASILM